MLLSCGPPVNFEFILVEKESKKFNLSIWQISEKLYVKNSIYLLMLTYASAYLTQMCSNISDIGVEWWRSTNFGGSMGKCETQYLEGN